jgi:hypothetical protein
MQAIRSIHVIDGKPTLSAELMAGLVHQRIPGALLRVVESTNDRCVVHAGRPGQEATPFTFTLADAKRAGIDGKQNWRTYPRAMLRSRCVSEACRAVFPDAIMGCYTPDEMGAETTEAGEPLPEVRPVSLVVPDGDAPYVFGSGSMRGKMITEVPTDYLTRLLSGEHPITAKLRATVQDEIERRIAADAPNVETIDVPNESEQIDPVTGEVT